jgi:hypothetical protein
MAQLSVVLPQQRKSFNEKKKDNFKWGRDCIDAIAIRMYQFSSEGSTYHTDVQRKLSNYRLYNNQIDQSDFERECNPYGITAEEFQDKIQPYNKTYNKINVLLGEELKRPFNFRTYLVNSQAVNSYTRKRKELQKQYVEQTLNVELEKVKQRFLSLLEPEQQTPQTDEEKQQLEQELQQKVDEILSPEQIEKYMKTEWRDGVEIMMDQLLQWFNRKLRIKRKKNDGFKHALIAGEEFVWVGVINGEPVVELLNPIKVSFQKSSEVEFVQDGYFAGYRTRMTPGDVLDKWGDDLTEDQKSKIDRMQSASGLYGLTDSFIKPEITLDGLNQSLEWRMTKGATGLINTGSYGPSTLNDIDVVHVEWRSQREFGFLKYIDQDGEEQLDLVDETFKAPSIASKVKFEDLFGNKKTKQVWVDETGVPFEYEKTWLPEVWEGTKISGDIYVNIRPKPYQSRSLNDPFKVKLGYHGLVYNAMNAPNISTMDRMKPFQYLYFIVMHKMKQIIAADKVPLTMIDMSMIPKTLTNEQWLYYYNQGLGFYDANQNNTGNPGGNQSGTKGPAFTEDRSVMAHVNNYIQILAALDEQISEVSGVTRQREGQTSSNEAVTNAQQNITQSSHITEILFHAHTCLWEQVLTSLVETAQLCYKDQPKKIPVVLDDMSRSIIELNPEELTDADLGVFITDDPNDAGNMEQIRARALDFIQNGSTVSDIAKLYRATSMSQLEREFKAIEDTRNKLQQAQEQAANESQEKMVQMQLAATEDAQAHEIQLEQMKIDGQILLKQMEIQSQPEEVIEGVEDDTPLEYMKHELETTKADREFTLKQQDQNIKREDISIKDKQHKESLEVEKEKMKSDERIKEKEIVVKKIAAKKKPTTTKK